MAYLTAQTEQGNGVVTSVHDGIFECAPAIPERVRQAGTTNTWHMWHMKAVGTVGEAVRIRLTWPSYDPDAVPDEIKNRPNFEVDWQSFVTAARDVVFMSVDRIHWQRIEPVTLNGQVLSWEAVLPAEEVYFTVTLYYTPENYKDLRRFVSGNSFCRTELLGQDADGDDILAFCVTDFSVPESEKIGVFLMGAQHCSEFNGAHLCDRMMRYFCTDTEAQKLLRRYVFRFVPVASVTSWRKGMDVHESGINPNRDWVQLALPSTQAIHRYLADLPYKPQLLIDIHSGLANYGSWNTCQALSVNDLLPEAEMHEMERFYDVVYANCDFLSVDKRYWISLIDDTMFDGYGVQYGQTHTMEISHYAMYDRAAGHHFPIDQARLRRFAEQLPTAIDLFFTAKKA